MQRMHHPFLLSLSSSLREILTTPPLSLTIVKGDNFAIHKGTWLVNTQVLKIIDAETVEIFLVDHQFFMHSLRMFGLRHLFYLCRDG